MLQSERRLEYYFQRQFNSRSDAVYKIFLTAISREVDFWNEIEKAERIYSLEFIFNPPNLFEGRFEANELVDEAYKATDFSEFKIKFINEKGRLKVMEENLHNFVSLIASGAGRYIAKMVRFRGKKRETRKINSNYFGSQQTLPDDIGSINLDDLNKQLNIIDKLNEQPKSLPSAPKALSAETTSEDIREEFRESDDSRNRVTDQGQGEEI